jgi:hypothetical protein
MLSNSLLRISSSTDVLTAFSPLLSHHRPDLTLHYCIYRLHMRAASALESACTLPDTRFRLASDGDTKWNCGIMF